jgi:hypothetical protein
METTDSDPHRRPVREARRRRTPQTGAQPSRLSKSVQNMEPTHTHAGVHGRERGKEAAQQFQTSRPPPPGATQNTNTNTNSNNTNSNSFTDSHHSGVHGREALGKEAAEQPNNPSRLSRGALKNHSYLKPFSGSAQAYTYLKLHSDGRWTGTWKGSSMQSNNPSRLCPGSAQTCTYLKLHSGGRWTGTWKGGSSTYAT